MNQPKILVVGGCGFIGSHIVEYLVKKGRSVRVLDNLSTGKYRNIAEFRDGVQLIEGDIRSYRIVEKAVKGINCVFHQAALASVPRSIEDPQTTNDVNVKGTLNLLEASRCAGVKKFIYASSSSVYGDDQTLPKLETMTPNPVSPYAASKVAKEYYASVYSKVYNIQTVGLRYFNIFGPRQDFDSQYASVIPLFIKNTLTKQSVLVFGDGTQTRDFTYVANAVQANIKAANANHVVSGKIYNCACGKQTSLISLLQHIGQETGLLTEAVFKPQRLGDITHSIADITSIKTDLGYNVEVDFDKGLRRTIEAYKKDLNFVKDSIVPSY